MRFWFLSDKFWKIIMKKKIRVRTLVILKQECAFIEEFDFL